MFLICSIAALFECVYFSSGKEVDCAHSEPISTICRRRMMKNRLAGGLVIFLIVPYMRYRILNSIGIFIGIGDVDRIVEMYLKFHLFIYIIS